jgi:hypothetical protein
MLLQQKGPLIGLMLGWETCCNAGMNRHVL